MALKGLTKSAQELKSTDQKIEDFINGSTKRVKSLESSQQLYRRFTFSLTSAPQRCRRESRRGPWG